MLPTVGLRSGGHHWLWLLWLRLLMLLWVLMVVDGELKVDVGPCITHTQEEEEQQRCAGRLHHPDRQAVSGDMIPV